MKLGTVEHLICVLSEWAQMELRHMNLRSDTAGPSLEFRQRATDTDMEDSVPARIGMGGKAKSGRRKIKSVSNKPATMSTKVMSYACVGSERCHSLILEADIFHLILMCRSIRLMIRNGRVISLSILLILVKTGETHLSSSALLRIKDS